MHSILGLAVLLSAACAALATLPPMDRFPAPSPTFPRPPPPYRNMRFRRDLETELPNGIDDAGAFEEYYRQQRSVDSSLYEELELPDDGYLPELVRLARAPGGPYYPPRGRPKHPTGNYA